MLQFSQSFHQNMHGHPHNHIQQHNTAPANQSYGAFYHSVDGGSVDSSQGGGSGTGTLLEQVKKQKTQYLPLILTLCLCRIEKDVF